MLIKMIPKFDPDNPKSAIENMRDLAMEYADADGNDLFAFIHDDVEMLDEAWEAKVEDFMRTHERCGLVGFGGARGLGTHDIYVTPYRLQQLARIDFCSNMQEAESHGRRVTEPMRVAVLDGFSQIFRKSAYDNIGGWDAVLDLGLSFHMYDYAAACMLRRCNWHVWMLPLECIHYGGRTSTSAGYDEWLRSKGIDGDLEIHQRAHEICYEAFRDVVPFFVEES